MQTSGPDSGRSMKYQGTCLGYGPTKGTRSVEIVGVCRQFSMMAGRVKQAEVSFSHAVLVCRVQMSKCQDDLPGNRE